ncbi:MAG: DNA-binding protein [Streptomycetaceae bacterium]|uniref:Rv2175c family DNA-binding protein n=1 Tax=Yinghuangia aomiensis TaxID=676205 RepID=A0ABP9GWX4_9ACTN|nr:DNA-binding protein [Streptomycetaceae bacterium]NUS55849.1 DNA-binding protein [Streptomycetaceae bacterium]
MSETDTTIEKLIADWLTLPDLAEIFGVEVTRIRQLLKDRQILAVRRGENNSLQVPAAFIQNNATVKGLTGTFTVLEDAGFSDREILEWLFTPDESLPGTPIDALRGNRKTEVRRRAQALAV